jgi:hypothetical protein
MNIFYCPKCNTFDENVKYDRKQVTWINPRDGWGKMITHIVCPHCEYVLSGVMTTDGLDEDAKEYTKYTISLYSDPNYVKVDKLVKQLEEKMQRMR